MEDLKKSAKKLKNKAKGMLDYAHTPHALKTLLTKYKKGFSFEYNIFGLRVWRKQG